MGQLNKTTVKIQQDINEGLDNQPKENIVFDDIPTAVVNIKLPPTDAPEEVLWDHGIASGINFPTLGFDVGEYVFAVIQSPFSVGCIKSFLNVLSVVLFSKQKRSKF